MGREGKSRVGVTGEYRVGGGYEGNIDLAVGQGVCLGSEGLASPCGRGLAPFSWDGGGEAVEADQALLVGYSHIGLGVCRQT